MHATDRLIRAHLEADDPKALELIWEGYANDLFGFLASMLCSRHDAEDALQEVFVKIARSRRAVASARDLKSYLFRMAKNEAIDAIHRRSRDTTLDPEDDAWILPATENRKDQRITDELADALADLPEEQRTVVTMKTFQDMTLKDIARLLGISQNTVASRFRYGIERLRARLKEDAP